MAASTGVSMNGSSTTRPSRPSEGIPVRVYGGSASPRLYQAYVRAHRAKRGDDVKEHVDPLAANRAAGVKELQVSVCRTDERRGLAICIGIGAGPARGMHAVG